MLNLRMLAVCDAAFRDLMYCCSSIALLLAHAALSRPVRSCCRSFDSRAHVLALCVGDLPALQRSKYLAILDLISDVLAELGDSS